MLTIITALLCEARPIISHYKLKKITTIHPYQIYQNDNIILTVSGVGKAASASATGYSHAIKGSPSHSGWLNIGMAGHSDFEICTGFLANKIYDRSTAKVWFPPIVFEPPCLTDQLHTVDRPDSEYHYQGGVDMEASGFYATASRFTTGELVQCYKVVSDNQQSPVKKFSANDASDLIETKMEDINFLVEQLLNSCHELASLFETPVMFDEINAQTKLTHSEQLLLKERLRKLHLLNPKILTDSSQLKNLSSGKELLNTLDQMIANQEIIFSG